MLFLAKVILKTLINYFPYINRVLLQHVMLCKGALLRMCLSIGVRSVLLLCKCVSWCDYKSDSTKCTVQQ